jgi:hypothetical protein
LHIIILTKLRGVDVKEPISMKIVLRFIPLDWSLDFEEIFWATYREELTEEVRLQMDKDIWDAKKAGSVVCG